MKITTVLMMAEIESSLEFWTKRIGFEVTGTVPHGDKLGFVMMQNGTAELMLQSHASSASDVATLAAYTQDSKACLFIEVADFADIQKRVEGATVAFPVRDTFYGMREIGVFEPGGNLVIFASPLPK